MNLDFLRRWLGETTTVTALRADLAEAKRSLARCQLALRSVRAQQRGNEGRYRETEDHNDWLRKEIAALRAVANLPDEPGKSPICNKIRLRDQAEAAAFARRVEAENHLDTGTLTGYACQACPRQIVSTERFWHITHTDPAQRGTRAPKPPRRSPGLITHASPADVARLHAKTRGVVNG